MKVADENQCSSTENTFSGFTPLTGNFLYCPNQFFDICLPNCSRGAVRFVAYVLRQTLGWLDKNGNPINQEIVIPYREFINNAGISRGALPDVIREVIDGGFVTRTSPARSKSRGLDSMSAVFRIRWASKGTPYSTNINSFSGFFSGEGNRTPIPNDFFDRIIPNESLTAMRIVGVVLRHTIGYQNQFGGRRTEAVLSFSSIQQRANIASRSTLSKNLRHVLDEGYIIRTSVGVFDPCGEHQCAASYAPRWALNSPNAEAALQTANADRFKNRTSSEEGTQFKKETSFGSKTEPENRFKKRTTINNKENNTLKQQHVAADNLNSIDLLKSAGFDDDNARTLAGRVSFEVIRRQIEWLPARSAERNPVGLLRKAIQEDWAKPASIARKEKDVQHREKTRRHEEELRSEELEFEQRTQAKRKRRSRLLAQLEECSTPELQHYQQRAIDAQESEFWKQRLRSPIGDLNQTERDMILDQLALDRGLPPVIEQPKPTPVAGATTTTTPQRKENATRTQMRT